MANILKVSTPASGYENSTKTNPININDQNIQNITDPTKITRPDARAEFNDPTDKRYGVNYESNFDKFMQIVRNTPGMDETFAKMFFMEMGFLVNSGIKEDFAQEIAEFMEMIKMDNGQLLDLVKDMSKTSVRFKGAFFNLLYQVLDGTTSVDLKTNILDFLKKYNDFASGKHILNNIFKNLSTIVQTTPRKFGEALAEAAGKLNFNAPNGKVDENVKILKEKIIPFLGKYIATTHDLGRPRDMITLLTTNIAKYENGAEQTVLKAFESLLNYPAMKERFEGMDLGKLFEILASTDFEKAARNMETVDKLVNIIKRGAAGEAGHEAKTVFENILTSVLINESVYMPLLHFMIPAEINGNLFFSEIWLDPDDEKEQNRGEEERSIKLLIKFDIKDVGFFDLILRLQGEKMDMQLYYPKKLEFAEKEIRSGIGSIVERNGFSFKNFYLEKSTQPKSITEVFPKIYERKNAINVTV